MPENKKFKPKYYAKVPLGKNKNRYFYSKEEYLAYLKDKKTATDDTSKKQLKETNKKRFEPKRLSDMVENGKLLIDKISERKGRDTEPSVMSGKNVVNTVLNKDVKTDSATTVTGSKGKDFFSNLVEKGKQIVDKTVDNAGDTSVSAVNASDVVRDIVDKVVSWTRGGLVKIAVDELKEKVEENEREKERAKQLQRNEADLEQREKELTEQQEAIDELSDNKDLIPGLDMKEKPCTDAQDMEAINPYYDGSDNYAYSNNCAYCTAAYELRQRGYDVEAAGAGYTAANTIDEICDWYEGEEVRSTDDFFIENNVDEATVDDVAAWIEDDLLKHGDGARGQFLLYWEKGGGHSVVWEVVDNDVILRDCQTNEILDVADYLQYASAAAYFRTDNIELSDNIKKAVVNTDDSRRVKDHL